MIYWSDWCFRLRKSQENLAYAMGDTDSSAASPRYYAESAIARSRSIGNLRHQSPTLTSQPLSAFQSTTSTIHRSSPHYTHHQNITPLSTMNTLTSSRHLARSVGSLHAANMDSDGSFDPHSLSQTIRELKKASNSEMNKVGIENNERGMNSANNSCSYYAATVLPKRKGAVQKRVRFTQLSKQSLIICFRIMTRSQCLSCFCNKLMLLFANVPSLLRLVHNVWHWDTLQRIESYLMPKQ